MADKYSFHKYSYSVPVKMLLCMQIHIDVEYCYIPTDTKYIHYNTKYWPDNIPILSKSGNRYTKPHCHIK